MVEAEGLLILTYRPGHTPPLRDRAFHTRLALTTLSTVDSIQMARAVFAAEDLPEELEQLIARKTEGNPFFVAVGNPTQLWKTHVAVGRLHEEMRNVESARQAYQAARDVIDGVRASLRTPALRASFERSPAIRAVFDLGTPR